MVDLQHIGMIFNQTFIFFNYSLIFDVRFVMLPYYFTYGHFSYFSRFKSQKKIFPLLLPACSSVSET